MPKHVFKSRVAEVAREATKLSSLKQMTVLNKMGQENCQ